MENDENDEAHCNSKSLRYFIFGPLPFFAHCICASAKNDYRRIISKMNSILLDIFHFVEPMLYIWQECEHYFQNHKSLLSDFHHSSFQMPIFDVLTLFVYILNKFSNFFFIIFAFGTSDFH